MAAALAVLVDTVGASALNHCWGCMGVTGGGSAWSPQLLPGEDFQSTALEEAPVPRTAALQGCGVALQQVLTVLVQIPGPRATPLPCGPFLLSLCACSCAHGGLTALHLPVLQV